MQPNRRAASEPCLMQHEHDNHKYVKQEDEEKQDVYAPNVPKACKFPYKEHNVMQNLFRYRGTVLPGVLCDLFEPATNTSCSQLVGRPTFWVGFVVFAGTTVCRNAFADTCGTYRTFIHSFDRH